MRTRNATTRQSARTRNGNQLGLFQRGQDAPRSGNDFRGGESSIYFGPAEDCYVTWPSPTCIIVDGPYGISGFPGDHRKAETLSEWYAPHVEAWSGRASGETTLWFWGTEIGWANVHPVLAAHGWEYRCCNTWDKGMSHVAGNTNTQTLRKLPVVTELCVQYVKSVTFTATGRQMSMQEWLRHEWQRSGLPLTLSNAACGVKNAATRKYLTADHLWYYPPPDLFERLAEYANTHGAPRGRPYFSRDGKRAITAAEWATFRAKFNCEVGVTNVWQAPQVAGAERIQGERQQMRWKYSSLHGSQKPLSLIELTIRLSTDPGDVVWEPFGGLCPAAVASVRLGRRCYSAEIVSEFFAAASHRLAACMTNRVANGKASATDHIKLNGSHPH